MNASFGANAMDLSGLAAAAKTPAGASYVVEADEKTFENVLNLSMRHPVVIEFYSPRANADALSADLKSLANAAAGRWLLVRLNVDAAPRIAQALGIQAVPMVVGVLSGQLMPLFQGTRERSEVSALIDQLIQAAVANGVVAKAQPVAAGAEAEAPLEPDVRFAAADAAMEAGDYALAVAEFDKILSATPGDSEAAAGKAGAELLVRLGDADPNLVIARATAHPDDVDAQLAAADMEVAGGVPEAAFARLIGVVRATSGADRDKARVRLLALFETIGSSDPMVLKARRDLMSALY
ncbi:tetratricopeptide repeat protein [Propioniciclava tarda]|uniref:tetratricopeptide repeat protein n=1 Tax=Propioniciclava tarda TaxID=433330 RepID=UPI00116A6EE7|nr:tetratricopeptide repeat protein [Propioniciclava tarda]SMO51269.1 putative thioredoxin [Propioniciclava tarda]